VTQRNQVPEEWIEVALEAFDSRRGDNGSQRHSRMSDALQAILPKVRERLNEQAKTLCGSGILPGLGEVFDAAFPPEDKP